ncbi:nitrogenase-stabilizing/protective protein NifW [Ectothiorhodospira marina]|uniref:Nitrogenase-stabilizing/protective protein NifW n=1 Tax=Ectothiorhodospira marina TaxID=1396821 RepID=A0A1H7FWT6_9GAMM|nr:nitrogenase-stabilizing/protective protein NifW [Ectothiorhodospira marina]SEK30553.1 nitrogenase-stabilizing/protective protein [Ectothiorhodospira marina]
MNSETLQDDLQDLESAEDFLEYFDIPYNEAVVKVNRLHILQRFHDYLSAQTPGEPSDARATHDLYRGLLSQAYSDFVNSDAQTEKVFKVFQRPPPGVAYVSLDEAFGRQS